MQRSGGKISRASVTSIYSLCGSANDDSNRSSYGRDTLTKADLEEFAGMIDFSALNSIG